MIFINTKLSMMVNIKRFVTSNIIGFSQRSSMTRSLRLLLKHAVKQVINDHLEVVVDEPSSSVAHGAIVPRAPLSL